MMWVYFMFQGDETCVAADSAIRKPDGTVIIFQDEAEWKLKPGVEANLAWAQITEGTTGAGT